MKENKKKGVYSPQGIDNTKRMKLLLPTPVNNELKNYLKKNNSLKSINFISGFLVEENIEKFLKSYREDNNIDINELMNTTQKVKIPAVFPQHFKNEILPKLIGK